MRRLLRPTLAGRVMLALLIAFALVWVVLMARQLYITSGSAAADRNLQALGDNLLAALAPVDTSSEARAVVAASEAMLNRTYRINQVPGAALMTLHDRSGTALFASAGSGVGRLRGTPGRVDATVLDGRAYRVYLATGARWTVLVAIPRPPAGWLIGVLGAGLAIDMLVALPFVLLPLWWGVWRGLAPLRSLSDHIAARGPDDLTGLGIVPRHAELQPLAAALERLLAQLRGTVAREHAFVQDAAHELRTPMAVMAAEAHVLAMTPHAIERSDAARRMAQAIARASHLVTQLLELAHLGQQHGPAPVPQDAAQLLRRELALLAPTALARRIDLSLDAPDQLTHPLEAQAFQSIVQNLVNNALAYVPAGGQVRVTLQTDGAALLLHVADDGPGIAADMQALVFERFHRGSGHAAPGAGLGLAIVRTAAARLGGEVTLADGIDGAGCAFVVRLPA